MDLLEDLIHAQSRRIDVHDGIIDRPGPNDEQRPPPVQYDPPHEMHISSVVQAQPVVYAPDPSLYQQPPHEYGQLFSTPDSKLPHSNSRPQPHQRAPSDVQPRSDLAHPTSTEYYDQPDPVVNSSNFSQTDLADPDLKSMAYDLLYGLVDLYFKHINTWCPILHRKSTVDRLFGSSALEEADRILLHAMVTTTLRFSTDPRLNLKNRKQYHDVSKQRVLLYAMETSSVKALQTLVILSLDLTGSTNGPPGRNVLAVITQSVVDLGLAMEMTSSRIAEIKPSIYTLRATILPEPESWMEDEGRRRLFWMVYILDRYATVATAFDFMIKDSDIDRRLPCRDDLFSSIQPVETRRFRANGHLDHSIERCENLGEFSYYCEALGILGRIHQFLKRPIDIGSLTEVEQWQRSYRALDKELTSWICSLPEEYGNFSRIYQASARNKAVSCGWIMLHATYHTSVIRLHSSAAYPAVRSPIFAASRTAINRCLLAVDSIVQITRYVVNSGVLDVLGPSFAFTVWVSSRLLLVHGSTVEHKVSPDITFSVSTLGQMGRHWDIAKRYSDILTRVLEEYHQSETLFGTMGGRATPQTVKILADMRR